MRIVKRAEISSAPHPSFEQIVLAVVVVVGAFDGFVAINEARNLFFLLRGMLLQEVGCRRHDGTGTCGVRRRKDISYMVVHISRIQS